jgi:Domain of unknown function (DUF4381)
MDEQYGQLIEPQKISFAFGAPGWYVLAFLLLIILSGLVWILISIRHKNIYRHKALVLLEMQIEKKSLHPLYETNMLLKQVAMSKYGRTAVANLRNHDWVAFLNSTMRKNLFSDNDSRFLEKQLYGLDKDNDGNEMTSHFLNKAKEWIRKHRPISV